MTVYHVEFAKTGHSLTGGEVCMLELVKYFQSQGYKNVLLTTDNGKETYVQEVPESDLLEYRIINSFAEEQRYGVLPSYILRTSRAIELVGKLQLAPDDLVICHSDFFPNSIPAWKINKNNPNKSANLFHLKAPSIFRGYEGEFTGRYQIPRLTIIHYQLNQRLYRMLTRRSTVVFSANTYYEKFLKKKYPHNRIKTLEGFWGLDHVRKIKKQKKEYDLIWVGRLHPQKGVKDLALVVHELAKENPDIKLVMLGDGPDKAKQEFIEQQKALGITKNIHMAGFVGGDRKFEYYAKSRVFVMPSYYESFGGVTLEAMASGLPVVAYDLPVYDVFKPALIVAPVLDYKSMAQKLLTLLDSKVAYDKAVNRLDSVVSKHSWAKTGEEILGQFA